MERHGRTSGDNGKLKRGSFKRNEKGFPKTTQTPELKITFLQNWGKQLKTWTGRQRTGPKNTNKMLCIILSSHHFTTNCGPQPPYPGKFPSLCRSKAKNSPSPPPKETKNVANPLFHRKETQQIDSVNFGGWVWGSKLGGEHCS